MLRLSVSLLAAAAAAVAVPLIAGATGSTAGLIVSCSTQQPAGAEVPATPASPDLVTGAGGTSCAAADGASPASAVSLSGSTRLELWLEELNPSTGAGAFVRYSSTAAEPLAVTGGVANGVASDLRQGVPAAGQTDPATVWQSLGVAEYYAGVPLVVDGVAEPTAIGCEVGDYSCATSPMFLVL